MSRRHRLILAWVLIGGLLATLLGREGFARWQALGQWHALAQSAVQLQGGPNLSLERLRQSAQARQVEVAEVEPLEDGWQVRGKVADERTLQAWLQTLQHEGGRPLQWALEQEAKGLRFELRVEP